MRLIAKIIDPETFRIIKEDTYNHRDPAFLKHKLKKYEERGYHIIIYDDLGNVIYNTKQGYLIKRKRKKFTTIRLGLQPWLYIHLKEYAKNHNKTVTELIRQILIEWIEKNSTF